MNTLGRIEEFVHRYSKSLDLDDTTYWAAMDDAHKIQQDEYFISGKPSRSIAAAIIYLKSEGQLSQREIVHAPCGDSCILTEVTLRKTAHRLSDRWVYPKHQQGHMPHITKRSIICPYCGYRGNSRSSYGEPFHFWCYGCRKHYSLFPHNQWLRRSMHHNGLRWEYEMWVSK